jgi:hypothetical protein
MYRSAANSSASKTLPTKMKYRPTGMPTTAVLTPKAGGQRKQPAMVPAEVAWEQYGACALVALNGKKRQYVL